MLEVFIGSLFVGSLGLQSLSAGSWLYRRHLSIKTQYQEEEENLTQYDTRDDSAFERLPQMNGQSVSGIPTPRVEDWEYKIVRASSDLFRDPDVFQQLCQEEAEVGWLLLEKLDDRRVRFKRPVSARETIKTDFLSIDPYRSHYGPTMTPVTWFGAIAFIAAMLLPAYLGYTLVSEFLVKSRQPSPVSPSQQIPFPQQSPNSTLELP